MLILYLNAINRRIMKKKNLLIFFNKVYIFFNLRSVKYKKISFYPVGSYEHLPNLFPLVACRHLLNLFPLGAYEYLPKPFPRGVCEQLAIVGKLIYKFGTLASSGFKQYSFAWLSSMCYFSSKDSL